MAISKSGTTAAACAAAVWATATKDVTGIGAPIGYQGSLGAASGYSYQPAAGKAALMNWAFDHENMQITNYDGANTETYRFNNAGAGSYGSWVGALIATNTRYGQAYNNDAGAHDISYTGVLFNAS